MAAIPYDPSVPEDSRWDWMVPIPNAWLSLPPAQQVEKAIAVILILDPSPNTPEVSTNLVNDVPYFFVNWPTDPEVLVATFGTPTIPKTAYEEAMDILRAFNSNMRDGNGVFPTLRETQIALVALLAVLSMQE